MDKLVLSLILIVTVAYSSGFHLQGSPQFARQACAGYYEICSMYGLTCRGHQRFDADSVQPWCDLPNQRTCGISAQLLGSRRVPMYQVEYALFSCNQGFGR